VNEDKKAQPTSPTKRTAAGAKSPLSRSRTLSSDDMNLVGLKYEKLQIKDHKHTIEVKETDKLVVRDEKTKRLTKELTAMISKKLQSVSPFSRLIVCRMRISLTRCWTSS